MFLLIDIGNTRFKWAWLDAGVLGPQSAMPHASWTRDDLLTAVLKSGPRPERVLVSNVGGARIGDLVRECIASTWGLEAELIRSTAHAAGVRNAYPEPAKLGVDRWLAVIAAHAMERRAACVVSVGTAMTIDSVDAAGWHLGGVIVPGPDLMVSSLFRNTSDIARRAEQGSTRDGLFADNTLGAVQQGAVHALAALIERAVKITELAVQGTPAVLLTGGASERVEGALGCSFKPIPDLVLRGLAVLATEP
jgi:type III pantothenate kinase